MLKQIQTLAFMTFSLMGGTAKADAFSVFPWPSVLESEAGVKGGSCGKVSLSKEQREKLKAAYFKAKSIGIEAESQLKKGELDLERAFSDSQGTFASAQAASKALIGAHGRVMETALSYRNEVYFSIFKAEQREAAKGCESFIDGQEQFARFHGGLMALPAQDDEPGTKAKESAKGSR